MSTVAPLNRSLDQELLALMRGVSLECLVCGEFVVHVPGGGRFCPECGSGVEEGDAAASNVRHGQATSS
ncbi:MAG: hypothetical protein ACXWZT_11350 [Gaiellaceae bacterium]